MGAEPLATTVDVDGEPVSALWQRPRDAVAAYVFAHGAGAGMHHEFMAGVADALAAHGIATFRYQFPYAEKGGRRPDPPELCHRTVRAAVAAARRRAGDLPLVAGGKSFGGRMTSQAQALEPLPGVRGLAFVGFPLHPAKKPSAARATHLDDVHVPMLFLQGTRDALASPALVADLVARLGARATLASVESADHAFHVPARSGRTDDDVRRELAARFADWVRATLGRAA
jgi:predicted alpha/beta-hydrolase family hydrolase